MHSQRNDRRARAAAAKDEDLCLQSALLLHLLTEHPIQLTEDDLIRKLSQDPDDFGERDDIERAVTQLAAVGLLHRQKPFVLPSTSAFRAYELWEV